MADKIFFFHNPKAGGYSLRRVFESHFRTKQQCPIIENDKVGHQYLRGAYTHFRGYNYYAGHYGRDVFEAVNDGHRCVTNFRNPSARLVSLYNYFRFKVKLSEEELRSDRFRAVAVAKLVSFEEFVSTHDPEVDVYIRNAHVRQLANSCWNLETTKSFEDICRFVDQMPWYYVCEYPEMSIAWFRRAFHWNPHRLPRENVTQVHDGQAADLARLNDRTRQVIFMKNDLDFALYHYAVGRFITRVTAYPTGLRNIVRLFALRRSELSGH